jgi:hypothetical protein
MKYLLLPTYALLQMLNAVPQKRFKGTALFFGYQLCLLISPIFGSPIAIIIKNDTIEYLTLIAAIYCIIPFSEKKYNKQTLKGTETLYLNCSKTERRILGFTYIITMILIVKMWSVFFRCYRDYLSSILQHSWFMQN